MHDVDLNVQHSLNIYTLGHKLCITVKTFSIKAGPDTLSRIAKLYIYLY